MKILLILSVLCLVGCATSYHSGAFTEAQYSPNTFRVTFHGNHHTRPERAEDFVLLRCAEVAVKNNFRWFLVLREDRSEQLTGSISSSYGLDHTYNNATISGHRNIYKPTDGVIIRCFKDQPADPNAFDATFLLNHLSSQYHITIP